MIELRRADFTDYRAIATLHAASWRQNYQGIYSESFLDNEIEADRLELWLKRLSSPPWNQEVYLVTSEGNIAGFSCLYLDEDPTFGSLLDNLHVSRNFQKTGMGRLLIQNCAKIILNKADIDKMYLWVFDLNSRAKKVYEHLGGKNVESVEKQNEDGTKAFACRYVWQDVRLIT